MVKVPARARSGDVKVVTGDGTSGTKRIVVESASPRITSVSPRQVQYNQVVTVTGTNFGSSRGQQYGAGWFGRDPFPFVGWLVKHHNQVSRSHEYAFGQCHCPYFGRHEQRHPLRDNESLLGQCFSSQR